MSFKQTFEKKEASLLKSVDSSWAHHCSTIYYEAVPSDWLLGYSELFKFMIYIAYCYLIVNVCVQFFLDKRLQGMWTSRHPIQIVFSLKGFN